MDPEKSKAKTAAVKFVSSAATTGRAAAGANIESATARLTKAIRRRVMAVLP
jgi:ribosomal protein S20